MSSKDWADEKADQIVLQWNRPTAHPITDLIADALRQVSENSNAADLAALRAENQRLREALQEISRYLENPDTQFAVPMIDVVRAALA